jgi:hypothetical protein
MGHQVGGLSNVPPEHPGDADSGLRYVFFFISLEPLHDFDRLIQGATVDLAGSVVCSFHARNSSKRRALFALAA